MQNLTSRFRVRVQVYLSGSSLRGFWKIMAVPDKAKAVSRALRRLQPFLVKNLTPDVRHELYARDMLTWHEQETIGVYTLAKRFATLSNVLLGLVDLTD